MRLVVRWLVLAVGILGAALAALAMMVAAAASRTRERSGWLCLSVALLLLSLDEKVLIHERLPVLLGMEHGSLPTHEWLLPGVLMALAALSALLVLVRPLPPQVRTGLLLASWSTAAAPWGWSCSAALVSDSSTASTWSGISCRSGSGSRRAWRCSAASWRSAPSWSTWSGSVWARRSGLHGKQRDRRLCVGDRPVVTEQGQDLRPQQP